MPAVGDVSVVRVGGIVDGMNDLVRVLEPLGRRSNSSADRAAFPSGPELEIQRRPMRSICALLGFDFKPFGRYTVCR